MSKQALGNAIAGILFLIIAVVDFTRDDLGIGTVFLVFAAVFLGLAFSARKAGATRMAAAREARRYAASGTARARVSAEARRASMMTSACSPTRSIPRTRRKASP